MSSIYPPFSSASAQLCQRCGRPLPPNELYCGNCGQYNTPAPSNNPVAQSPSGMLWGSAAPQISHGTDQFGAQQWGQPPTQSPPNNLFVGSPVPQQPFGIPGQPNNFYSSPNQQQSSINNFYSPPGQQSSTNNFYSPPNQQSNNFYGGPGVPQQPSYPQAPTNSFQPGSMNNYQTAGFPQTLFPSAPTGFPSGGNMNNYQPQQPIRKRGPKVGLIIGIVVLLLVVVGGSIGGFLYIKKYSSISTTTTTTPTVVPTPMPTGKPLFSDSFTNNKKAWDTTSRAGQFSVKIGGGSLILEDDDNKLLWELVPSSKPFGDFFLTVDAILSKGTQGNGYGIYIRGASSQSIQIATYYRFELYGDGSFAIFKGTVDATGTSKSNMLVDFTNSPAILKQGQVNHIGISAKGATMTFLINGHVLKTLTDNTYASGSVAMFVSNLQNVPPVAQATFSNLVIYPPQSNYPPQS